MPDAWKALATVSGATAEELFDPICFIENKHTDTQVGQMRVDLLMVSGIRTANGIMITWCVAWHMQQVWLFRNVAKRCVCVAFRGTEQTAWKDMLTDVRLTPTAFDPERTTVRQSGGFLDGFKVMHCIAWEPRE